MGFRLDRNLARIALPALAISHDGDAPGAVPAAVDRIEVAGSAFAIAVIEARIIGSVAIVAVAAAVATSAVRQLLTIDDDVAGVGFT